MKGIDLSIIFEVYAPINRLISVNPNPNRTAFGVETSSKLSAAPISVKPPTVYANNANMNPGVQHVKVVATRLATNSVVVAVIELMKALSIRPNPSYGTFENPCCTSRPIPAQESIPHANSPIHEGTSMFSQFIAILAWSFKKGGQGHQESGPQTCNPSLSASLCICSIVRFAVIASVVCKSTCSVEEFVEGLRPYWFVVHTAYWSPYGSDALRMAVFRFVPLNMAVTWYMFANVSPG
jgi:hypothetical protein